jgi:PIN domain
VTTAANALLFIDSNIYLDLYRTNTGKLLLAPIQQQADHIFVTCQIVDEVNRNKVTVTAAFLKEAFKKLELRTQSVPDHLFGVTEQQSKDILANMKKLQGDINQINNAVRALATGIIDKVSHSNDEVSLTLQPISQKAIRHTEQEMQQARVRKERGHPPGKRPGPIGDELNWEQILSWAIGIGSPQVWIITKDRDYGTIYNDQGCLNQFLHDELVKASPRAKVFFFDDVAAGIKHFADTTGVNADKLPTKEQVKAIKEEEETLPPLELITASNTFNTWITTDNSATIRARRPTAQFVANVGLPENQTSTASPHAAGETR